MNPATYNTLWYSFGVASSLSALGCLETILSPSIGRSGGDGSELVFVVLTGFIVFFGIAYGFHYLFSFATEQCTKKKTEKRSHVYPLVNGLTFSPLAKLTTEAENSTLIYVLLIILAFHPLASNFLLATKLNQKSEPVAAGQRR